MTSPAFKYIPRALKSSSRTLTTHRVENGVTADLQTGFNSRPLGVDVPELSLEKAHLVLKGFRAS